MNPRLLKISQDALISKLCAALDCTITRVDRPVAKPKEETNVQKN